MAAALRVGKYCSKCSGRCVDEPSEASPIEIRCFACGGRGCDACHNTGKTDRLTKCPRKYASEMADLATTASMIERGFLPVSGGWLDQSDSLIRALELLWYYESELSRG